MSHFYIHLNKNQFLSIHRCLILTKVLPFGKRYWISASVSVFFPCQRIISSCAIRTSTVLIALSSHSYFRTSCKSEYWISNFRSTKSGKSFRKLRKILQSNYEGHTQIQNSETHGIFKLASDRRSSLTS
jgi:hypothetical protein